MDGSIDIGRSKGAEFLWLSALVFLIIVVSSVSACQRQSTVCPEESITYFTDIDSISTPSNSELIPTPALVEIKGKMTEVDRVIHGPICADTWGGTIYIACDIQIAEWTDAPLFFKECPLTIKPDTKIYVAAHNDTAYYKGCSCHTGELAEP